MNPWNMSRTQTAELQRLKSSNLKVARAWAIKETFMDAFAFRQPKRAERALKGRARLDGPLAPGPDGPSRADRPTTL